MTVEIPVTVVWFDNDDWLRASETMEEITTACDLARWVEVTDPDDGRRKYFASSKVVFVEEESD